MKDIQNFIKNFRSIRHQGYRNLLEITTTTVTKPLHRRYWRIRFILILAWREHERPFLWLTARHFSESEPLNRYEQINKCRRWKLFVWMGGSRIIQRSYQHIVLPTNDSFEPTILSAFKLTNKSYAVSQNLERQYHFLTTLHVESFLGFFPRNKNTIISTNCASPNNPRFKAYIHIGPTIVDWFNNRQLSMHNTLTLQLSISHVVTALETIIHGIEILRL